MGTPLDCLDGPQGCSGSIEYRMALSGTGRSFPRCEAHWERRLKKQEENDRKYPQLAPLDFSPADAGERWDEEY